MQQVETGSRFWWRALDAHQPEPVASSSPPLPRWRKPRHAAAAGRVQPRDPYALQIPKADRRSRRHASQRMGWQASVLSLLTISIAGVTAAVFAMPNAASGLQLAERAKSLQTGVLVTSGFGIAQVSVTGQRYTSDADVFDALDLRNVRTFADLDAAAALKRIERLPWVDTAQITRVYPDRMNIQIRERIPYAQWRRDDRTYLIDATGRVLGPIAANQSWNLPLITGEGANGEAALLLNAVWRHGDVSKMFSRAERVTSRRWAVILRNGTRIELGAEREDEGLAQVASNFELRRALTGAPMVIDVRTPGRPAIRPVAPGPAAAVEAPPADQVTASVEAR